jgi:nitrogen fixation-related uncharacterized protein
MTLIILDIALWSTGLAWFFDALRSRQFDTLLDAYRAKRDAHQALLIHAANLQAQVKGLQAMNLCLRRRLQPFERKRGVQGRFIKSA